MKFQFNPIKNSILLQERGINFDIISDKLSRDQFLTIEDHPNSEKYPKQKLIYLEIDKEVYVVPCIIEEDGTYFLKTIFPSRKARKKLLEKTSRANKKPRLSK